jgi:3-oxoacyl-[acyl-carrier protein] reductase
MHTIDLTGKAAIITGGTRGIGRTIAQTLAEAGADVALFYRADVNSAIRARDEIMSSTSRRAEVYQVDVRVETAVEAGLGQALEDFGSFPIVVHNAGHGISGMMPDLTTEAWRSTIAVNLDAAFFLTRSLLRHEGALLFGSSIVFIASGRGHDPAAGMSPYGAAKAGLIHFAAMLAQDVGTRGIRVNVVSPGFVDLGRPHPTAEERAAIARATALRRVGTPGDVAGAVLFFASELSGFVTGQWIRVNGGIT